MKPCHRCGHAWQQIEQPGFNNTCEHCGIALHACSNCTHYRPRAQVRCALPNTDRVLDAVSSNRCASFEFRSVIHEEASAADTRLPETTLIEQPKGAAARSRWDKLFG